MDPLIISLLFFTGFCLLVARWANEWNRNPWGYGFTAFLFSPLVAGIVLLIAGKKKNEDQILDAQGETNA